MATTEAVCDLCICMVFGLLVFGPRSLTEGASLRYMVNRNRQPNRQTRGHIQDIERNRQMRSVFNNGTLIAK